MEERSQAVAGEGLDLRRYVEVLLNWWWLVLLAPLVGGILAFFYSASRPPVYRATATILVQQTGQSAVPTIADIQTSERLAKTYRELVTSRTILEEVVNRLGISLSAEALKGKISGEVVRETQLLRIHALDTDPRRASQLANTTADVFITRIQESRINDVARLQALAEAQGIVDPSQLLDAQLAALGSLTLVEKASVPSSPVAPKTSVNVFLGVLLGLLVGVAGSFVLEYFTDRVRSPERVERLFGLPSLGVVPEWRDEPERDIPALVMDSDTGYADAYHQLRANLQFVSAVQGDVRSFVITSAEPGEGKTTTAVNLAVAMALTGRRVVLIDGDLRRPSVHSVFGVPNERGLSNLLAEADLPVEAVARDTGIENLEVITSGPRPPDPARLLALGGMARVVRSLLDSGRTVVVDSPPALGFADTLEMASVIQGVVLVASAGKTRTEVLRRAIAALGKTRLNGAGGVLGVVLNRYNPPRIGYYRYGYYYRYYYYRGRDGRRERRRRHRRPWWRRVVRRVLRLTGSHR